MPEKLSVILCTHNPHPERLARTFQGLKSQLFSQELWELIVVDNASTKFVNSIKSCADQFANARIVQEDRLGLLFGRITGFQESTGEIIVFLDDDIVLDHDYLRTAYSLFSERPRLGGAIGRSLPGFELPPPDWTTEFHGCLGLWDHGKHEITSATFQQGEYPWFAGGGGGAVFRRQALFPHVATLATDGDRGLAGRTGKSLSSGEDNHIVLSIMKSGWLLGYFPSLSMTHLMPSTRLTKSYLARLNRGIARSWVRVLDVHGIRPWPPISRWTVLFRKWRAYLNYRAWAGPAEYVRWQGACGQFEGRADIAGGGT